MLSKSINKYWLFTFFKLWRVYPTANCWWCLVASSPTIFSNGFTNWPYVWGISIFQYFSNERNFYLLWSSQERGCRIWYWRKCTKFSQNTNRPLKKCTTAFTHQKKNTVVVSLLISILRNFLLCLHFFFLNFLPLKYS